ncbi:MAG: MBL fold metallo-hydrolase [Planctomycetes bacterium]|nr:MBL fold metallo-hydrolase [Planctomycetota bacterium]
MPPAAPAIQPFALGPFETNCYLVTPSVRTESPTPDSPTPCWIIDASFGPAPIIRAIAEQRLSPQLLILTHAHADHMAGVEELRAAFPGLPVLIHRAEKDFLTDPRLNLSAGFGMPVTARPADRLLEGDETLELAGETWRVLHTPGHSPGGITLVHDASRTAIVGDTLFSGSVGRTDFPTSNPQHLVDSVRTVLYRLPHETRVFPGHGPPTTIAREARSNPFVPESGPTAFD